MEAKSSNGEGWLTRMERSISEGFLFKTSRFLATVCGVCLVVLLGITLVTVAGRRSPWAGPWLAGGTDISEVLMSLVSVLAAANCWYEGGHINIGIITEKLSARGRAIMDCISAFVLLVFVAALAWPMGIKGLESLAQGEHTMMMRVPIGPFQIIFALVLVHFALVLLRSVFGLAAKAAGRPVRHGGLY